MGGKTARADMTEQERLAARRHAKHAQYLASIGQPVRIPATPAIEHFRDLTARGMSAYSLAAESGLSVTSCRDLIRGRRPDKQGVQCPPLGDIYRETVEAALAVRFVAPTTDEVGKWGPGVGTKRRIRGLMADGWSLRVVGELLDLSEQRTWQLAIGSNEQTTMRTDLKVAAVFEKLQHVSPSDYGLTDFAITRAKNAAKKRGYVPSGCWDEDTIEDPEAVPEYTGHCGTEAGWLTHHLNEVPMCTPCTDAVFNGVRMPRVWEVKARYEFDSTAITDAMSERCMSATKLEQLAGVTRGVVGRWLNGEYSPTWSSGLNICTCLDLSWTDIYKRKEDA